MVLGWSLQTELEELLAGLELLILRVVVVGAGGNRRFHVFLHGPLRSEIWRARGEKTGFPVFPRRSLRARRTKTGNPVSPGLYPVFFGSPCSPGLFRLFDFLDIGPGRGVAF